jgi:hypothetical protein
MNFEKMFDELCDNINGTVGDIYTDENGMNAWYDVHDYIDRTHNKCDIIDTVDINGVTYDTHWFFINTRNSGTGYSLVTYDDDGNIDDVKFCVVTHIDGVRDTVKFNDGVSMYLWLTDNI